MHMDNPALVLYPDPKLTTPSLPVAEFDEDLLSLASTMCRLMVEFNGVGLAAVQIGLPLRLFVMASASGPAFFVNPEVQSYGPWYTAVEGCLSVPGRTFHPPRPRSLVLSWRDLDGAQHTQEFCSREAHIIAHEMDHLMGILAPKRCSLGPATSD
jgi:peptide deformylase